LCAAPVNTDGSKGIDTASRECAPLLVIALAVTFLSLSGCTLVKSTYDKSTNVLNSDQQYRLTAIEFGELGSYADPAKGELDKTIELLKNTQRPLLVVYIHGWLNNITSDDVGNFKGFLSRLAQSTQVKIHHYNVLAFILPGLVKPLTFLTSSI
jgi:hypothetical protein